MFIQQGADFAQCQPGIEPMQQRQDGLLRFCDPAPDCRTDIASLRRNRIVTQLFRSSISGRGKPIEVVRSTILIVPLPLCFRDPAENIGASGSRIDIVALGCADERVRRRYAHVAAVRVGDTP